MKINKDTNEIIFNVDPNKITEFELALSLLKDVNPDIVFINIFINRLSREALRQSMSESNLIVRGVRTPQPKEKLIKHWAEREELTIHKIFKSFLTLKEKEEKVFIKEMENLYDEYDPDNELRAISKFISNFRLLCTEGRGAYGKFFDYDKISKEVNLTSEVKELVLQYKSEFLK